MNLTPLDIRRQQFTKAFRGYEPTEVDTFLKQVSDQLEAMLDEVRHANERVRDAEAKLTHYEKVELALQEALESARETARRAEASAEAKAKLILEEAELKAERLVHDAERERYRLRQDLAKLNSRQAEVAARLRGFLLSELEILAQFQGDDPVGFIKLQSAGTSSGGTLPSPAAQISAGAAPRPAEDDDSTFGGADQAAFPPLSDEEDESGEAAGHPEPAAPAADTEAVEPETMDTFPPGASAPEPPSFSDAPEETSASSGESEPWTTPAESATDAPVAEEPADPESETSKLPPAVTGGWDLRSLVTGEERSVAASEAERERIRRILDDLD